MNNRSLEGALGAGRRAGICPSTMKIAISWRRRGKNTSFAQKRLVVALFPVWDIAGLKDLSPILKHKSPVAPAEVELPPLRTMTPGSEEDSSPSNHYLSSVMKSLPATLHEAEARVLLMNVHPRIAEVEEGLNLLLSLPDKEERLWAIMSHMPVRSLEGWRG